MSDRSAAEPRRRRRWLRWVAVPLCLLLGFAGGWSQPIIFRPPLVIGQDAVAGPGTAEVRVSLEQAGGTTIVVRPAVAERDLLVIFYPGGLVRPQAYEWFARSLAASGITVVIPEVPFDLAVLDSNRAAVLIDRYGAGKRVVLAGHSLGGAMAAQWVASNTSRVSGLILEASYPPSGNQISAPWPALVLRAERDGVAKAETVRAGLGQLPSGSREVVIAGAVHSFFGRYGPQAGDGVPSVARVAAEAQIVAESLAYLNALP